MAAQALYNEPLLLCAFSHTTMCDSNCCYNIHIINQCLESPSARVFFQQLPGQTHHPQSLRSLGLLHPPFSPLIPTPSELGLQKTKHADSQSDTEETCVSSLLQCDSRHVSTDCSEAWATDVSCIKQHWAGLDRLLRGIAIDALCMKQHWGIPLAHTTSRCVPWWQSPATQ